MADTAGDFLVLQRRLALHLRDPDSHDAPAGLEDRRLAVYRELFFNNLLSLFAGNFPVLRSLHDDATWSSLVRAWFREHRAHTPLFPELGREFVRWLEQRSQMDADAAWLAELAHYEWMEVVAGNNEADIQALAHQRDGDLIAGRPLLSPLAWPLVYRWPVHRLSANARPAATAPAQPTCLIIVRGRDDHVGFLEANAMTLRLIDLMREQPTLTGGDLLGVLADEAGIDRQRLLPAGRELLERLRSRDIVLGIRTG